jgi:hypothetical protein
MPSLPPVRPPLAILAALLLFAGCSETPQPPSAGGEDHALLTSSHWEVGYDERGVRSLVSQTDPHRANVLPDGGCWTRRSAFAQRGEWQSVFKRFAEFYRPPEEEPSYARRHEVDGTSGPLHRLQAGMPFALEQTFTLNGERLEWNLAIENRMGFEVNIGDVAIQFPSRSATGSTQEGSSKAGSCGSTIVSGDGSFLLFIRRSGAPPYLLVTVKPGTRLEYVDGSEYFVRSGYSGNAETRGTWRQPHTYDRLAPAGSEGDRLEFGLRAAMGGEL